jgi:hypothetical protein
MRRTLALAVAGASACGGRNVEGVRLTPWLSCREPAHSSPRSDPVVACADWAASDSLRTPVATRPASSVRE